MTNELMVKETELQMLPRLVDVVVRLRDKL